MSLLESSQAPLFLTELLVCPKLTTVHLRESDLVKHFPLLSAAFMFNSFFPCAHAERVTITLKEMVMT